MPFQFGQNSQQPVAAQPITVQPTQPSQPVPQPATACGVFSGVGQATPSLSATYCGVGIYQAQIVKAFIKTTQKREQVALVEMRICNVLDDVQGRGHRVMDDVTWCIKVSNLYFLSEIRSFVAGSIGADFNTVDEATCTRVFSDENPLAGCFVEWKGVEKPTQAGGLFTKITFVRNVPAAEIKQNMDPAVVNQMFPNGALDQLIANES